MYACCLRQFFRAEITSQAPGFWYNKLHISHILCFLLATTNANPFRTSLLDVFLLVPNILSEQCPSLRYIVIRTSLPDGLRSLERHYRSVRFINNVLTEGGTARQPPGTGEFVTPGLRGRDGSRMRFATRLYYC